MADTLLDIVQAAAEVMGLGPVSAVVSSTDKNARRLMQCANAAGKGILRQHDWGDLITLATVTTVAGQSDYTLPAGYDRMVSDTQWDQSTSWRVRGPDTPQRDRWQRDGAPYLTSSIGLRFRQIGRTAVRIFPTPSIGGDVVAYEYVSANWVLSSNGVTRLPQYGSDGDTCVWPSDLMIQDIKWRFMSGIGMGSAQAFKFERDGTLTLLIAADVGGTVLNMGEPIDDRGSDAIAGEPTYAIETGTGDALLWE